MNTNHTELPSARKSHLHWIPYLFAAVLLISLFFLWRELGQTRQRLSDAREHNTTLKDELKTAKSEINQLSIGDSSAATRERLATMRSKQSIAPEKETETLVLQSPTVRQTEGGLVVHFGFEPADGIELPDDLILAVRLPMSSSSKLLALSAASTTESSKVRAVVNPTGYIGFIQGAAADLKTLTFEFTVSAPVTATVSGSEGIVDYAFDITPDGCTVRKL